MKIITATKDESLALLDKAAKSNPVYRLFAEKNEFFQSKEFVRLQNSKWRGDIYSDRSLQFFDAKDIKNQCSALKDLFGIGTIVPEDIFDKKYDEAIRGGGHEWRRIHTLHSSSLLGLLCFYHIHGSKLVLPRELSHITFKDSKFEHKNTLSFTKSSNPPDSNIDVTLFDGDKLARSKNVLFLESKFTEYLKPGKQAKISIKAYESFYSDIKNGLDELNIKYSPYFDKSKGKEYLELQAKDEKNNVYYGGLQQMISHFMGACTYATKHPKQEVYLGEILYKFDLSEKYKCDFQNYINLYKSFVPVLDKYVSKPQKLHVLPECLTYQQVFEGYPLDDYVQMFYKL